MVAGVKYVWMVRFFYTILFGSLYSLEQYWKIAEHYIILEGEVSVFSPALHIHQTLIGVAIHVEVTCSRVITVIGDWIITGFNYI